MKKWLLFVVVIIGILITSSYVFFPKSVIDSNIINMHCNTNSLNRYIMTEKQWKKWWPGTYTTDSSSQGTAFDYNGYKYYIREFKYNAIDIEMQRKDLEIDGTIYFIPIPPDSVRAEWKYKLTSHSNPLSRIRLYMETKRINQNMNDILAGMKKFMENEKDLYGLDIKQTRVKDTIVVITEYISSEYPSTKKIYDLIGGIKNYIAIHHAKEVDPPMLNVTAKKGKFVTKLAIPVNKDIPGNKMYSMKYLVPGKILEAQVTGGITKANGAFYQMKLFVQDNDYSSPAIPFQSLVTDRMKEPDSTKWITKLYYPIF
jgi:hypothetical protein